MIISGGIDLSVGAALGLSGMVGGSPGTMMHSSGPPYGVRSSSLAFGFAVATFYGAPRDRFGQRVVLVVASGASRHSW